MSKGIVYFIQPAELVGTNRYKIGCSKEPSLKRLDSYLKNTRYLSVFECFNPMAIETEIKKQFSEKYKLFAGKEWFEGDEYSMLETFVEIVMNHKKSMTKHIEENNWLKDQPKPWTAITCAKAASLGYLESLKNIHKSKCPWDGRTFKQAVLNGHLECLKYAHENGCPWSTSLEQGHLLCSFAAQEGHLDCLKYLHENGYPWNEHTCERAARRGHLLCLKYAHENGCPLGDACYCGSDTNLECVQYAFENGCSYTEKICYYAAECGKLDILQYAHKNGCPWDDLVCWKAAERGHLDCLQYAHKNGCPWDEKTIRSALERHNIDCLRYAYNNGCPCNDKIKKCAAYCGHYECLKSSRFYVDTTCIFENYSREYQLKQPKFN